MTLNLRYLAPVIVTIVITPGWTQMDFTKYVNPFIGTAAHGHTYPGPSRPFGMVQLSPDTRLEGWDGCSGYHFSDDLIYGFSHTHLSGTGIADYADILFMPSRGTVYFDNGYTGDYQKSYASKFSHENESATAGYYRVVLDKHNILAELTTTERVGFQRYTFRNGGPSHILLDLLHRDKVVNSLLRVVNDREIEGFRFSTGWARDHRVYFVARFSKPFTRHEIFDGKETSDSGFAEGKSIKAAFHFDVDSGETVLLKVGISAVDIDGARKNLDAEIDHWDFDRIRDDARTAWNRALDKIQVKGGSEDDLTIFYTALYHSLLNPNLFSDTDGRHRGMDGKIYRAENRRHYTVFSLWDTFRATHPLFTIIERERTREFIETLLAQYDAGGLLPIWELAGNYTGTMIGYHAIPVIVDAYLKGIRNFDAEKALTAMIHSAEQDHRGLEFYKQQGFIGAGDEAESVSRTLEYAYDDWCIAVMAQQLGKMEVASRFFERAQFYRNVFDPESGFMRARVNGGWFAPFDPAEVNFNYTEANSWQYSFFVPHDIETLVRLHSGSEDFERNLDGLFSVPSRTTGREQADITGMIGQYAHGNEPSHHMAYLYNYIKKPWKTGERVDAILHGLYDNTPAGLCGNEDCGQMSAWYALSALGFYPVTPGSPDYVLGKPLFDEAAIHLENGKIFTIRAKNHGPDNPYVQSVSLNGKPHSNLYITHDDLIPGGELTFTMGTDKHAWQGTPPRSQISENLIAAAPFFTTDAKTFTDSLIIGIGSVDPEAEIRYTLDGNAPDEKSGKFDRAFTITESCTLKARAFVPGRTSSPIVAAKYLRIDSSRSITLKSRYASQYSAGGDNALIDYIRGGNNFRTGDWQGYQGQDFEAIVDLGKVRPVKKVAVGFLQEIGAWVFFPPEVSVAISQDGAAFREVGKLANDFPDDTYGSFTHDFSFDVDRAARFIKVYARYYGPCPDWHPGAGGQTWLFLDEIVIE